MTGKQLINSIEDCVDESLRGFSKLHPHLFVDLGRKIVLDAKCCQSGRVAVISGGGSGHEPFPAGYVGEGMLTASVSGPIFTSPPSKNVLHCVRLAAAKSSGVLLLVPNYTGDVLNFGLAAETALGEGIRVESIIVGEDAAQEAREISKAGKRGMCGLVLVFKIAGYLAQTGRDLETVKELSKKAALSMASMGLCVSACCKPGVGFLFRLDEDEMEVGVGVHGEAGVARVKMLSAKEAVEMLLQFVLRSLKIVEGEEVVALFNNLGSLSYIEQWLLAGELEGQLTERKIKICILKLDGETRETFLTALDHPTTASAWINQVSRFMLPEIWALESFENKKDHSKSLRLNLEQSEVLKQCFVKISNELTKQESYLNYLDSICGDGDCGTSFAHVATILKNFVDRSEFSLPVILLSDLCSAIEESIGGTTGALYGLFLKGCVTEFEKFDSLNNAVVFSKCWRAGVETIKKYSYARMGDRTMLDSLEAGCQAFESHLQQESIPPKEAFRRAVDAAVKGCENTKFLKAMAGRASYTDQSQQKDVDVGAYAVTLWLSAILSGLDDA